jgi:hypothetical protein
MRFLAQNADQLLGIDRLDEVSAESDRSTELTIRLLAVTRQRKDAWHGGTKALFQRLCDLIAV